MEGEYKACSNCGTSVYVKPTEMGICKRCYYRLFSGQLSEWRNRKTKSRAKIASRANAKKGKPTAKLPKDYVHPPEYRVSLLPHDPQKAPWE